MTRVNLFYWFLLPVLGFVSGFQLSLDGNPFLLVFALSFFYSALNLLKEKLGFSLFGSYLFGYGFFVYSHAWVSTPLMAFGEVYTHLYPISYVTVPAMFSLYFLVVGWVGSLVKTDGIRRVVSLSLAVAFVEFLRCECIPSLPLGQLGTVWFSHGYMAQSASLFGVYGLSFLTVFIGFSLGQIKCDGYSRYFPHFVQYMLSCGFYFLGKRSLSSDAVIANGEAIEGFFPPLHHLLAFLLSGGVFVALSIWGGARVSNTSLDLVSGEVRLVPTDWRQQDKYKSLNSRVGHLKELVEASKKNLSSSVNIIVWPETVMEFQLLKLGEKYEFSHSGVMSYLEREMPRQATLLAGGVLRETGDSYAYNALFAFHPDHGVSYAYKKRFLAPFGEFMPSFLKPLTAFFKIRALDDFGRGSSTQEMIMLEGGYKIKPVICYEGSFSRKILNTNERPDLLVTGTNDVWFSENGKEQQFISHAFRAIEEGIPMVRVANSGLSGYISPLGKYSYSRASNTQELRVEKPLPSTVFRRLVNFCPNWLEWLFGVSILVLFLLEMFSRRRGRAGL